MNQPLYKLAENKKLPKHQFMDADTLLWISKNIPNEIKNINYSYVKIKFKKEIISLLKYLPKIEWFENELMAKGIHGILHLYRVTVYLLILNSISDFKIDKSSLYFMGLFHDIKRLNDKSDADHGEKSAEWVKKNKSLIESFFNKKISNDSLKKIILSISLHDINDFGINEYNTDQLKYINILKSADALDRYRLPKIKWWINNSFLCIKPFLDIKAFAFNFILFSEIEENNLKPLLTKKIKCFLQT